MQQFALLQQPKRVLEIGIFTGTATVSLGSCIHGLNLDLMLVCPQLALALVSSVQTIVGLDIEPFLEKFARPFWERAGVSNKIQTVVAPATDTLQRMKKDGMEPFDLVFIDADKPSYGDYVKLLFELDLVSEKGVVLAVSGA